MPQTGAGNLIESLGGASGIAGAALGILPTIAQWFTGGAQRRRARAINPTNPGFVQNQGLLDNKQIIDNTYNNFSLPGKSGILNMIQGSFANGMDGIERGATSSEDILGGVTNLNFNQDQTLLDLGINEAEMKQGMLPMLLNANAAAGNEAVRKNQYDNDFYQQELARKASLETNGAINQFKSGDNLATLGGSLLNYRAEPWSRDQSFKRRPFESYNKARGIE